MRRRRDAEGREGREGAGYGPVIAIVVVLALLVGGGWAAAYRMADDRVPHGTTLAGVDIGGMTRDDAVDALRRGLATRAEEPIQLTVEDGAMVHALQLDPDAAGLHVDYGASVAHAMGDDSWKPDRLWDFYIGSERSQPVVSIDEDALRSALSKVADDVGSAPRDGAVRFRSNGDLRVVHARPGKGFDLDAAVQAVLAVYLTDDAAVVPLTPRQPAIDDDAVQKALDSFANPAVSESLALLFGDLRIRLFPRDYVPGLRLVPRGNRLVPSIDRQLLMRLVSAGVARGREPVDAGLELVGGRPRVVPATPGTSYAWPEVRAAFLRAARSQHRREVAVRATPVKPSVTTADVRALGVHEQLSRVVVPVPKGLGINVDNLRGLATTLGDVVLRPGASFSLRGRLGSATDSSPKAGAWLATALFGAAYRAGLLDVEHHPLTSWVSPLPPGLDAGLGAGEDLRFTDDARHAVLIAVRVVEPRHGSDGAIVAKVFGTRTWDVKVRATREGEATPPPTSTDATPGCRPSPGVPAFNVLVTRSFSTPGADAADHDQQLHVAYEAVPAVTCLSG